MPVELAHNKEIDIYVEKRLEDMETSNDVSDLDALVAIDKKLELIRYACLDRLCQTSVYWTSLVQESCF